MQMPLPPIRAPTFLSRRRLFEQNIADLHKCTDFNQLKQFHALIYKSDLHEDPFIAPKLISAFSQCNQLTLAVNVFYQVPNPNANLYNALIRAYVKHSEPTKAFDAFSEMRRNGIFPDNYTYISVIKSCSGLNEVKMIHALVEKRSNMYEDLFIPNSLIDAYFKCGLMGIEAAKMVFNVMNDKDVVTYNSMIGGLVKAGELKEAQKLFDEMPQRDRVSWNAILNGYVKSGEMNLACEIFKNIPSRDVVSWSTLIYGYAKSGDIETAQVFFDKMPVKNLVTWTIMISAYAEQGLAKEAIGLYDQMHKAGKDIDDATFMSILSASAESGLLCLGRKVHRSIIEKQYKCKTMVSNALIDMYCKCGGLNSAWRVFKSMERKDLVSWNTMIHGMAMHGRGEKALQLFNRMEENGFVPDKVTFVGVLTACSHSGLINDGIHYFYAMEKDYCIPPEIEHYGCIIDLLGRGGRISEALKLLRDMPFQPNDIILSSFLAACRMHNAACGEEVLKWLEQSVGGNFSALLNMYAVDGDWGSVANVRVQMKKIGCKRSPGVSSIQLDNEFHEFTAMATSHPKWDRIYGTLNDLSQHLRTVDCAPNVVL